jgi:uncharacterized repeat protein (TIGR01451 family)
VHSVRSRGNHRVIDGRMGIIAAAGLLAAFLLTLLVGTSSGGAAPIDPADLSITKSDSPDPVSTGAPLTYSIQVANAGPDTATNIVVTDNLPKGVSFVSADSTQGSCSASGKKNNQKVTCMLGTIGFAAGPTYNPGPISVVIRVLAPQKAGTITNTASVTSDQTDPKSGNNTATATTRVIKAPGPKKVKGPTCSGRIATKVGTPGAEVLTGTGGPDVILARAGDDQVFTFVGKDLVCAGRGSDVVKSGSRADTVLAGPGADRLFGAGGGDALRGRRGPDRIRGGRGPDLLAGGLGSDLCFGGPGVDIFRSC